MIRFFKWLFLGDGHLHKWERVEVNEVVDKKGNTIKRIFIMQCKHCGKMKSFSFGR